MSEHDGTDDPYRTSPGRPSSGEPSPGQPHPQPYPAQPYPQPYPGGPDAGPPYPAWSAPAGAFPPPVPDREARPPAVGQLVQVMHAGAVAAVLQSVWAAIVADDLLAEAAPDLEQIAADSGVDAGRLADLAGQGFLVFLAVSTAVTVALWLVFARLFARGRGRVAGTVLGVLNLLGLLWGLVPTGDLVAWVLGAVSTALAVAGLVLLHRPATAAWFRAAEASRRAAWT